MKKVYFIYQDDYVEDRQSDGVEFCVIPEFNDGKIYFYCSEYMSFWKSVDDAGNLDKSADFKIQNEIRPATIIEISNQGLCGYIDTVKEYEINNGSVSGINYIHIPRN